MLLDSAMLLELFRKSIYFNLFMRMNGVVFYPLCVFLCFRHYECLILQAHFDRIARRETNNHVDSKYAESAMQSTMNIPISIIRNELPINRIMPHWILNQQTDSRTTESWTYLDISNPVLLELRKNSLQDIRFGVAKTALQNPQRNRPISSCRI